MIEIHVALLAAMECMMGSLMDMDRLFNDELAEFMLILMDRILVATIVDMLLGDSRHFLLYRVMMSLRLLIVVIAVVVGVIVGIE